MTNITAFWQDPSDGGGAPVDTPPTIMWDGDALKGATLSETRFVSELPVGSTTSATGTWTDGDASAGEPVDEIWLQMYGRTRTGSVSPQNGDSAFESTSGVWSYSESDFELVDDTKPITAFIRDFDANIVSSTAVFYWNHQDPLQSGSMAGTHPIVRGPGSGLHWTWLSTKPHWLVDNPLTQISETTTGYGGHVKIGPEFAVIPYGTGFSKVWHFHQLVATTANGWVGQACEPRFCMAIKEGTTVNIEVTKFYGDYPATPNEVNTYTFDGPLGFSGRSDELNITLPTVVLANEGDGITIKLQLTGDITDSSDYAIWQYSDHRCITQAEANTDPDEIIQMDLNGDLTTAGVTSIVTTEPESSVTLTAKTPPTTGTLLLTDNSGKVRRLAYTNFNDTTNTFTVPAEDFSSVNATGAKAAWVPILDADAVYIDPVNGIDPVGSNDTERTQDFANRIGRNDYPFRSYYSWARDPYARAYPVDVMRVYQKRDTIADQGMIHNSDFNRKELVLNTALTGASETSVVVDSIPAAVPSSGTIEVKDDRGVYRTLSYTSKNATTFSGITGDNDFSTHNASTDSIVLADGDGSAAYVDFGQALITSTGVFDITFQVKLDVLPASDCVLFAQASTSSSTNRLVVSVNSSGIVNFFIDGTTDVNLNSTTALVAGQWYDIGIHRTTHSTNDYFDLSIDRLVEASTNQTQGDITVEQHNTVLADDNNIGTDNFDGKMRAINMVSSVILAGNDYAQFLQNGKALTDATPEPDIIGTATGDVVTTERASGDGGTFKGRTFEVKAWPYTSGKKPIVDGQSVFPASSGNYGVIQAGIFNFPCCENSSIEGFELRNSKGCGITVETLQDKYYVLTTSLTTDNVTSVTVNGDVNASNYGMPQAGFIVVEDDNFEFRRLEYSSYSVSTNTTFTITTTDGNEDFASVNATAGNFVAKAVCDNVTINDCVVKKSGADGILVRGSSPKTNSGWPSNWPGTDHVPFPATNVTTTNVYCEDGCFGMQISPNHISGATGVVSARTGQAFTYSSVEDCSASRCKCVGYRKEGFDIISSKRVTFSDCYSERSPDSVYGGQRGAGYYTDASGEGCEDILFERCASVGGSGGLLISSEGGGPLTRCWFKSSTSSEGSAYGLAMADETQTGVNVTDCGFEHCTVKVKDQYAVLDSMGSPNLLGNGVEVTNCVIVSDSGSNAATINYSDNSFSGWTFRNNWWFSTADSTPSGTFGPTDNIKTSGVTTALDPVLNDIANGDLSLNPTSPALPQEWTLSTALTGAAETSVVINETPVTNYPEQGVLDIVNDNGAYISVDYTLRSGSTFTIPSTDFSTVNASVSNTVYVGGVNPTIRTKNIERNYVSDVDNRGAY